MSAHCLSERRENLKAHLVLKSTLVDGPLLHPGLVDLSSRLLSDLTVGSVLVDFGVDAPHDGLAERNVDESAHGQSGVRDDRVESEGLASERIGVSSGGRVILEICETLGNGAVDLEDLRNSGREADGRDESLWSPVQKS